jgi:NAD(P)H dehydrogenase (quinone)
MAEPTSVLLVVAHPSPTSFTRQLADRFAAGARETGAHVEVADLYAEGFDPVLRKPDLAQFSGGPMPDDVLREQARVDRADALVLAFPVWWWSFPAMLKGWVDRVWSQGWAYTFSPERSRGLLPDKPVLLLAVAGSRASTYRRYGYDGAMRTQIDIGVLGYGGLTDVTAEFFHEVDDDAAARPRHLARARALGGEWLSRPRSATPGLPGAVREA